MHRGYLLLHNDGIWIASSKTNSVSYKKALLLVIWLSFRVCFLGSKTAALEAAPYRFRSAEPRPRAEPIVATKTGAQF
jgi:hypothetical protein